MSVKGKDSNSPTLKDRQTASAVYVPLGEGVSVDAVSLDKAVLIAPARGVSGELSRQLHVALQNFFFFRYYDYFFK